MLRNIEIIIPVERNFREFSCGPMVGTQPSDYQALRLDPWLRNKNCASCMTWPKKKKRVKGDYFFTSY